MDHHATTPLCAAARAALREAIEAVHGNPSSVHALGRTSRALVERARECIAKVVGAAPRELVFTSGGTEAVHLTVRGIGEALGPRALLFDQGAHPSLRAACERLARDTRCALEPIPARAGGEPDLDALARRLAALDPPVLIAASHVQHETGALAPVRALADVGRAAGALLVLDCVQAFGKVPLDLGASGAVAAALSAHKIGGPTGVGAAWVSAGVRVATLTAGGAQERGARAGTENLLGIVAFGAAADEVPARLAAMPRVALLRDRVEEALRRLDGVTINGAERTRVATACHASLRGVAGEELVAALDLEGFCVSSGPACASGRPEPSASMRALYPDEPWRAASALRVTLGPETTEKEVEAFIDVLGPVVARVRG